MIGSKRAAGDRSLRRDVYLIRTAATVEAVALGHPEVDVDHLLLGLLSTGGPSAQLLARAGAGLAAVRDALLDLQEQDLRGLGVSTAAPHLPPLRAASRLGATAVPINGRAQELLDTTRYGGDDRGLLLALLDDDGGRARRILAQVGVDVDTLRAEATRPRPPTGQAPPADPGSLAALRGPAARGTTWMEASYSQVLPVPSDRVWALISDPHRRTEWDATCSTIAVAEDGIERITQPGGQVLTQAVLHVVPGREISWRRPASDTGADAGAELIRVSLAPSDDGTLVHLRRGWPTRGWSWRLARPLLVRMVRAQLRVQVHGLHQAAG